MTNWPKRLTRLRRKRGLTQARLGALIGKDQRQISRWELGKGPSPLMAEWLDAALNKLEVEDER